MLAHEVSQAVAQHGADRMSEAVLMQGVEFAGCGVVRFRTTPAGGGPSGLRAGHEIGRQLPCTWAQESEADHLGLIYVRDVYVELRRAY